MKTKELLQHLLHGAFIMQRQNRRKGFGFAVYSDKGVVLAAVSDIQLSTFKHVTKEKKGKITLNLNLVRQMHGKALPKILYKKLKQKNNSDDNA